EDRKSEGISCRHNSRRRYRWTLRPQHKSGTRHCQGNSQSDKTPARHSLDDNEPQKILRALSLRRWRYHNSSCRGCRALASSQVVKGDSPEGQEIGPCAEAFHLHSILAKGRNESL